MSQTDIARLFEADGPFTTVWLATPGSIENAAQQLETRWRNVRRELAGAGGADDVLDEIEGRTVDAHTRGASLVVIAGAQGVLHSESLPAAPPGGTKPPPNPSFRTSAAPPSGSTCAPSGR